MTLGLSTTATQQYTEQNQSDATDTAEGICYLGQLGTFDLPTAQQSQKYAPHHDAQADENGGKVNAIQQIALLPVGGMGVQT